MTVICWKWTPIKGYRSAFGPETVNILRRMVARHYPQPHRFVCVTDDARGIDADIEVMPDFGDFANVPSPHGHMNPSCYRRLRLFHPQAAEWFGDRFVSLDLDAVVTGDLSALWNRPEDFVVWGNTNRTTLYNGSMVLMTAGARPKVWTAFDPATSPNKAKASGSFGSDQGWMSYCLGPGEAKWSTADGVYSFRNDIQATKRLPENARIVMFHGRTDPWSPVGQQMPWVRQWYH